MALATEVAPGVHRVADGLVNWYLIVDGGEVAMVDAGWPRSWSQVEAALTEIGRSPADVRSVVLTHAHPDHLGAAEAVRERCGATVHVYRDEVDRAHGKAKGSSPFTLVPGLAPHLWRPSAFGFVMHATVRGFMMPTWVTEVESFGSDAPIDAPGRLRAVPTPGHTEGHVALVLEEHGVVFSGDSIATLDVLTRERGARLLPDALNGDPAQTRESLTALGAIDAGLVLPGHGEPFEGTPASAVERARDVDDGGGARVDRSRTAALPRGALALVGDCRGFGRAAHPDHPEPASGRHCRCGPAAGHACHRRRRSVRAAGSI